MKSTTQYGDTIIKLSEFVKQLDESVRAEAFKFLLSHESGMISEKAAPIAPIVQREAQSRAISPQELIRKTKTSSFTDKAVILAFWLEEYQKKVSFSSADLKA